MHNNNQTTKCVIANRTQQNLDCEVLNQSNTKNRLSKQTASGDTGDVSSNFDQPKNNLCVDTSNFSDSNKGFGIQRVNAVLISDDKQLPNNEHDGKYNDIKSNIVQSAYENKTNLIINYLPPNMSQEEVRALFSSIGEVESCKLVREKSSGESLGYAFVKFYDSTDASRAIKTLNGLRLQNKTVKVSLARPSSEAIKGANLYICGLPRKMTQSELEKLFSSCGHIITARILYDSKTGLSRGVAFIRYDQRVEAEIAIRKLNGYLPSGAIEPITVKFANSPSSNRLECFNSSYVKSGEGDHISKGTPSEAELLSSHPNKLTETQRVQGNSYGLLNATQQGGNPSNNAATNESTVVTADSSSSECNYLPGFLYPSPRTSHMSHAQNGVPSNCSDYTQMSGYAPTQLNSNGCPIPVNTTHGLSNNLSTGRSDQDVLSPLQRTSGSNRFKSHATTMSAAAKRSSAQVFCRSNAPTYPIGPVNVGTDFMCGFGQNAQALLAPAFAASSGALTATGWCIFVYNLAPETDDSTLWQLFGPFGAVQNVKVIRDPVNVKCKGFGFVTMSNYEEALLAIHSLNGFNLGNRVLQVSFKSTPNTKFLPNMASDLGLLPNLNGSVTPVPGGFSKI